jgi:hypothetical protein
LNKNPNPNPEDNDRADFAAGKRSVTWHIKNLRGGQNRQLTTSLTYKKGHLIDENAFKQLSPFNVDFDIPNHTASGIKISKMEAKVMPVSVAFGAPADPNANVEPGKWLRHKTFSGSYVFRV